MQLPKSLKPSFTTDIIISFDTTGSMSSAELAMAAHSMRARYRVAVARTYTSTERDVLHVYRSTDGGVSWESWSQIEGPVNGDILLTGVLLAEGTVTRIHLLYNERTYGTGSYYVVRHAWAAPGPTATWSITTPFSDPGFGNPPVSSAVGTSHGGVANARASSALPGS